MLPECICPKIPGRTSQMLDRFLRCHSHLLVRTRKAVADAVNKCADVRVAEFYLGQCHTPAYLWRMQETVCDFC